MSFTAEGTAALTTDLPSVPKHVTRIGSNDAVLYWVANDEMALRYQNGTSWTTTTSGPTSIAVQSQSLVGPPRNFADSLDTNDRWAFWPHIAASTDLQITAVLLDGDASTVTAANYVYANAVAVDETISKLAVTETGVAAFVKQSNSTYTLRFFTYPVSVFGGGVTAEVTTSTNPVVANYGVVYSPSTVARFGRDRVYTMFLDGSQTQLHYLDVDVAEDTVTFTTIANTTAGLPLATDLGWMGSVDGLSPHVATLLANGNDLFLTTTVDDGSSPVTSTLSITGSMAGTRKFLPFSSNTAFFYLSSQSYLAKVSLANGAVTSENTSFTSTDVVALAYTGDSVLTGTTGGLPVYGTNAASAAFGDRTNMGDAAGTTLRLGVIQGLATGSVFFVEENATGTQDLYRYSLTSAPSRGIAIASAYTNFRTLNANSVSSLDVWPNGDLVGVFNPTNEYGTYNGTTGDFTAYVDALALPFGNIGLAPNGRVFFNRGSGRLTSWAPGDANVTLVSDEGGAWGGVDVFANGLIVWTATPSNIYYTDPNTGTTTTLTGIAGLGNPYGIRTLSSGNVLVSDQNGDALHELSIAGTGSIVASYSTPSSLSPTALFRYDTDKFLVMFFSGTSSIYSFDYAGGGVFTEIPITLEGGGAKNNWSSGFGLCIGNNSKLYTVSTFSSGQGGFAVADPVE